MESLRQYVIEVEFIDVPQQGQFIEIPEEFVDNFIIGITDFSTALGHTVFDFNWEFDRELRTIQTINSTNSSLANATNATNASNLTGNNSTNSMNATNATIISNNTTNSTNGTYNNTYEVFGVRIAASIPAPGLLQNGLTRQGITMFYIKTWDCPSGYFFDVGASLCTICLVQNCLICDNMTFCYKCDEENNWFVNLTTGECEQCYLNECSNCSTLYTCKVCNANITYGVVGADNLINHNQSLLELCDFCNSSLDEFINDTSYYCQLCTLPGCVDCSNLSTCVQCN